MSGYYDVYALATARTTDEVQRFLAHFAPEREESADDYTIPRFSDSPLYVFDRANEVIEYCVSHLTEPQSIYWRCLRESGPAHAMVFFTTDGALLLGLSVITDEDQWLKDLKAFAGSNVGCVLFEEAPPDSAEEFRRIISGAA
jgi:hypothetical protein